MSRHKFAVLDDDPTGIQTVHGCLLITDTKAETVRQALEHDSDFFYVLTNTRAHTVEEARSIIEDAVKTVWTEAEKKEIQVSFISRSDSTLRSHFPVEVRAIESVLASFGEKVADAVFLIPAFFEGGRITREDTHFMMTPDGLVPTGETEFARDSVFGYSTSWLPGYINEKTGIPVEKVRTISLETIRGDLQALVDELSSLSGGVYVAVNAEIYADLDAFSMALRSAIRHGKRFMFQSSASFVKSVTNTPDKGLLAAADFRPEGTNGFAPGAVIVGSHVAKTTRQVEELLKQAGTELVEIKVEKVLEDSVRYLAEVTAHMEKIRSGGRTPVACTSRTELKFSSQFERLKAGQKISAFLVDLSEGLVGSTAGVPSFLIAKGGITSHDILKYGLKVSAAPVAGQVLPGVPAVRIQTAAGIMPYVIFPGNVGEDDALSQVYKQLR